MNVQRAGPAGFARLGCQVGARGALLAGLANKSGLLADRFQVFIQAIWSTASRRVGRSQRTSSWHGRRGEPRALGDAIRVARGSRNSGDQVRQWQVALCAAPPPPRRRRRPPGAGCTPPPVAPPAVHPAPRRACRFCGVWASSWWDFSLVCQQVWVWQGGARGRPRRRRGGSLHRVWSSPQVHQGV